MKVYRITLAKYSNSLVASGREARWNSKGIFVIYAAASRSLACLENLVHRGGEGLDIKFMTMVIEIPQAVKMLSVYPASLTDDWRSYSSQKQTRAIGDAWVKAGETAVLKVPSAIVPDEYNFLINPNHGDFKKIELADVQPFDFDRRLW